MQTPDIAGVLRINAESAPHVASLNTTEIHRLAAQGAIGWVGTVAQQLVAYLLAMPSSATYDGEEFQYFKSHFAEEFLYVDQVACRERASPAALGNSAL